MNKIELNQWVDIFASIFAWSGFLVKLLLRLFLATMKLTPISHILIHSFTEHILSFELGRPWHHNTSGSEFCQDMSSPLPLAGNSLPPRDNALVTFSHRS